MTRRNWMLATAGLLLFLHGLLAALIHATLSFNEEVAAGGCRIPVSVYQDSPEVTGPFIVVFHGLIANRSIMMPVGRALGSAGAKVFVVDFPGHGNNTDAFSFYRAEYCAEQLVRGLAGRKEIELKRTVLVGHSMGGAIAIRVGARVPEVAGVVTLSPPPFRAPRWIPANLLPYEEPQGVPPNLLILIAQADLPFSGAMAADYVTRHGGPRSESADFAARRALRFAPIPLSSHTGMMFRDRTWAAIRPWIAASVQASPTSPTEHSPASLHVWAGLFGLLLMAPLALDLLTWPARRSRPSGAASDDESPRMQRAWLLWLIAGLLAVAMLSFGVPMRFLRLFNGDYLASALLIAGVVLLALMHQRQPAAIRGLAQTTNALAIASAMASGFVVVLAFGAWLDASIYDAWLNAARWMRFPVLLLCALPYTLAEELALGGLPSNPQRRSWRVALARLAQTLTLRGVLWGCFILAIFIFQSGQILLVVMLLYLLAFTIGQRLGADAIRRRTGSVAAAACFSAVLAAWLLALFPLL